MTVGVIIKAKLGSTRLPKKVLREIDGRPMIDLVVDRVTTAEQTDTVIIAIPKCDVDDPLAEHLKLRNLNFYRGSEKSVLDRFYNAVVQFKLSSIVRITGDCPLIDGGIIDAAISDYKTAGVDYLSNCHPPTFPDGLDVEVFSFNALTQTWANASNEYDQEHVTPFMNSNRFKTKNLLNNMDLSFLRWTVDHRWIVDEQRDLDEIRNTFLKLNGHHLMPWQDILQITKEINESSVQQ